MLCWRREMFLLNGSVCNLDADCPNPDDTLAFVDEAMGYLGSGKVASVGPSNLPPWPVDW
jgi:hypothetical protein